MAPSSVWNLCQEFVCTKNQKDVAEEAEDDGDPQVEHIVVRAERADGAEQQDQRKEQPVGHLSSFTQIPISGRLSTAACRCRSTCSRSGPRTDRGAGHHLRPGRDAVDHHRAQHQRHRRVGRYAQRQHRNERRLRTGVVGASGPATPSIAPLPKREGSLASFFSTV